MVAMRSSPPRLVDRRAPHPVPIDAAGGRPRNRGAGVNPASSAVVGGLAVVLLAAGVLAAVVLAVAAGPGVAGAHSILVHTDPAPGDRLEGLDTVRLDFAHPVATTGHVVTVHDGSGLEVGAASYELPEPNSVVARFDQTLTDGQHEVVWDVVAGDGHHERGRIPITITAPAAPSTPTSPAPAFGPADPTGGDGAQDPPAAGRTADGASGTGHDDGQRGGEGEGGLAADGDGDGDGEWGAWPVALGLAAVAVVLVGAAGWRRRRSVEPPARTPVRRR